MKVSNNSMWIVFLSINSIPKSEKTYISYLIFRNKQKNNLNDHNIPKNVRLDPLP